MVSRNRTIRLTDAEVEQLQPQCLTLSAKTTVDDIRDQVINQDLFECMAHLPPNFVDLLFVDPPYNRRIDFGAHVSRKVHDTDYEEYIMSWLEPLAKALKPTASIYICTDWQSSSAVHRCCKRLFKVRNRITWERDKGRGAKRNWKNGAEDIWFCTVGNEYHFDVEAVKLKRKVIAPYRTAGKPKDWQETADGAYRLTHPSNLWTDLTVPFWSMPENTDHPTQKPEKLLAKIILASCPNNGVVLDPFSGSGTTAVTAKKLGRHFVAIDIDATYCCLAQKRLTMATQSPSIQGYADGVFWERNTVAKSSANPSTSSNDTPTNP